MKKFKPKIRKFSKKEISGKKCKCGNYIPNEYKECNTCLLDRFGLYDKTTYDALDFLGSRELLPAEDVIIVLRNLQGETFIQF